MTDKTITVTIKLDLDNLAAQLRAAADALEGAHPAKPNPSRETRTAAAAPDPLDESDHRPRHDNDGSHWRRGPHGWYLSYPENGIFTLTDIAALYGPLTFCDCEPPNAAGKAQTAPLSASEPFGALVDPPSPDSAPEALR